MKKLSTLFLVISFCCLSINVIGQAKKPTIMVVPSMVWCNEHNYIINYDNQGSTETIPDYKQAIQTDKDLLIVISKIGNLMAERGFRLKDLSQTLNTINTISAENSVIKTKTSGSKLAESPLDKLRNVAKADIIIEVYWHINENGPKKSITYNLVGLDPYTTKQIAGAEGTGSPSFSSELTVLIEEAVQNNMDNFTSLLQSYFDDLFTNGREVAIDIQVPDNGSGIDLEKEFRGKELSEIIDEWMENNTVNHRFSKDDATETTLLYNEVRIPMYKQNGMPMDTENFTRQLRDYLAKSPYNLTCKVIRRGLGRCLLVIGEK